MLKGQKHSKNQCFDATKTAKTIPQTALKSQKLHPRPPDKTHRKKTRFKTENRRPKVKEHFHFYLAGPGRAHARTSPKKFWSPTSRPYQNWRFWPKNSPPGKPVPYCLCHPDDHTLSTFGAGGFFFASAQWGHGSGFCKEMYKGFSKSVRYDRERWAMLGQCVLVR